MLFRKNIQAIVVYLSLLALCLRVPNHTEFMQHETIYAHIHTYICTCLTIHMTCPAQSRERATKLHNLYELSMAMAVIFSPKINKGKAHAYMPESESRQRKHTQQAGADIHLSNSGMNFVCAMIWECV